VIESAPDDAALSFEVALARLEKIVHRLEAGEATLEESIDLYTEGQRLKQHCEDKLAGATARIEAIVVGHDGRATGVTPFDAG
jgi:exodeoxyribonuclease VII small subunit